MAALWSAATSGSYLLVTGFKGVPTSQHGMADAVPHLSGNNAHGMVVAEKTTTGVNGTSLQRQIAEFQGQIQRQLDQLVNEDMGDGDGSGDPDVSPAP